MTTDANTGGSFNRYNYASNNPYKYIDPDGRQSSFALPHSQMGYMEAGTRIWLASWLKANAQVLTGALTMAGGPEAKVAKEGIVVTEGTIKAALRGSEMKTAQESVSLHMVKEYVKKAEAGEIAPAISVDGKVIVDGNHRYVAGEIAGKPVAIKEGTAAPSQAARAKPIEEIKVSEKDFRDSR